MHQAPFIHNLAFLGRLFLFSDTIFQESPDLVENRPSQFLSWNPNREIHSSSKTEILGRFLTKSGDSWNKDTFRNLWDGSNICPGISDFGVERIFLFGFHGSIYDEMDESEFFTFLSLFTRLMNFWLNEILRRL